MDRNKNCTACNIKADKDNYKKSRTICKNCYNKKETKNNKKSLIQNKTTASHKQLKINNVYNYRSNRTLLIGPSFSDKTYLILKFLSRIPNRDIYSFTKSPSEHYSDSKNKNKKLRENIIPLSEYENATIVFDDILGTSYSK